MKTTFVAVIGLIALISLVQGSPLTFNTFSASASTYTLQTFPLRDDNYLELNVQAPKNVIIALGNGTDMKQQFYYIIYLDSTYSSILKAYTTNQCTTEMQRDTDTLKALALGVDLWLSYNTKVNYTTGAPMTTIKVGAVGNSTAALEVNDYRYAFDDVNYFGITTYNLWGKWIIDSKFLG